MVSTSFNRTIMRRVGALSLALVLGAGMVGCASSDNKSEESAGETTEMISMADINPELADESQGVAVTLTRGEDKGVIGEKAVTDYIQEFRELSGLAEDEAWANWLALNDLTPESARAMIINTLIDQYVLEQTAAENGITAEPDELEAALETEKSNYSSAEEWQEFLDDSGYTEESYIEESIKPMLLHDKLLTQITGYDDTADEDAKKSVIEKLVNDSRNAFRNAKRASIIVFDPENSEEAEEVLASIKDGSMSFEDAAKEHSEDPESGSQGGDIGWNVPNEFTTNLQATLETLSKGDMSDLIDMDGMLAIVKCTDAFELPEGEISYDQIPQDIRQAVPMAAYNYWFKNLFDNYKVEVADMPEGLIYDVDMSNADATAALDPEDMGLVDDEGNPIDLSEAEMGDDGETMTIMLDDEDFENADENE